MVFVFSFSNAQNIPLSTDEILNQSFQEAKKENKNVFIMFKASRCSWCKTMEASMNNASIKKLFDDNYIIEHLVVLERRSNKHLENAGAEDLLNKYSGENQGIPFYLIFDSDGNLLADSKMLKDKPILKGEGNNIGYPGTADEIDAFAYKLKETGLSNKFETIYLSRFFNNSSQFYFHF